MDNIEKLYFDAELPLPEDKKDRVNEYVIFKAGYKSRDEEIRELQAFKKIYYPLLESENKKAEQLEAHIKRLREIIECKNILLFAYRTDSGKGVIKALDRLQALKDGE